MQKPTVTICRVCGCTNSNPCSGPDGSSCRDYKPKILNECIFCTKPQLRTTRKSDIKLVGKQPLNKKYIYRIDKGSNRAYQARVPIPELGRDHRNQIRCISAWFDDSKFGGRGKALLAAIKFRDEAIAEYNLSLEPKVKEPSPEVNIYWKEKPQHYLVRIQVEGANISKAFSIKHWLTKDNAHREAKRWRDSMRADLGLPPAPGAFNTNIIPFEERKQEIIEQRITLIRANLLEILELDKLEERERQRVKPNHDGVSRHKAVQESDRWVELVRERGLQMNPKTYHKNKYKNPH